MYNPETHINKRLKKPKGHSRMDNPEKLATLGAQDTRQNLAQNTLQRQTKYKPQHRKVKHTFTGGLLVLDNIMRRVVSVSSLTMFFSLLTHSGLQHVITT
jgi:hypothetical protein